MTLDSVIAMLRRECAAAGSQKAYAAKIGVSLAHINDVLRGRREPGPSILNALGLEKVVDYRRRSVP